jgi:GTPase SAR1 family protein
MKRIGVFGESECGKTVLVKSLCCEFWKKQKIPTLALDPRRSTWGTYAWTTTIEKDFRAAVWQRRGCVVVIEDSSETIQKDKSFTPFFTCIRHNKHNLIVIGHDATDLTRPMRRNLTELFLFNQTEDSVEMWQASQPSMKGLEKSVGLKQYEFIHSIKFSQIEPHPQTLTL